jgi:Family of unknown function (DUF6931)
MLEAFDPSSTRAAKPFVAALPLSDAAATRLESTLNVRRYVDRLLTEALPGDALVVIARALPVQLVVAWGCECLRTGLEGSGPAVDAERAAVTLAEQCLKEPTDANRQLCMEFGERGRRTTAGAWLATASAWADGHLTPPASPHKVPAPAEVVSDAVVASLLIAASRCGAESSARLKAYAVRALVLFGPRQASPA